MIASKMNFSSFLIFLFLILRTDISLASTDANHFIGKWYTKNNVGIIEFYLDGDELKARTYPQETPDILDINNPIDSLRSQKIYGKTIIYGLKYDTSSGKWDNGFVYNPEDGKTYSCWCILKNGTIHFRGFLKLEVLGKTQIWTRVPKEK